MEGFRKEPPKKMGDFKVLAVRDYLEGKRKDLADGKEQVLNLPKSNVMYYELENQAWCCVRPSGTEPKIKFYFGVRGDSLEDSEQKLNKLKTDMENISANV